MIHLIEPQTRRNLRRMLLILGACGLLLVVALSAGCTSLDAPTMQALDRAAKNVAEDQYTLMDAAQTPEPVRLAYEARLDALTDLTEQLVKEASGE